MTIRLAICDDCRRVLVEGEGPAILGQCISCAEHEARKRKRARRKMVRELDHKKPMTEEQRRALDPDKVFGRFKGD